MKGDTTATVHSKVSSHWYGLLHWGLPGFCSVYVFWYFE